MELKTLVWFFIILTLSTLILSNLEEAISSTRSRDLKEADESNCRKSLVSHGYVESKAWHNTKVQSVHATEVQILNEYGNRVLPFHSKKGLLLKAERQYLVGHRNFVSSKKNRASSLYRSSMFISAFPWIAVVFIFLFLLPL